MSDRQFETNYPSSILFTSLPVVFTPTYFPHLSLARYAIGTRLGWFDLFRVSNFRKPWRACRGQPPIIIIKVKEFVGIMIMV